LCSAHDAHLTPIVGTVFLNKGSGTRIPKFAFNLFAECGANSIMGTKDTRRNPFSPTSTGLTNADEIADYSPCLEEPGPGY
jgi:hypothetical protein